MCTSCASAPRGGRHPPWSWALLAWGETAPREAGDRQFQHCPGVHLGTLRTSCVVCPCASPAGKASQGQVVGGAQRCVKQSKDSSGDFSGPARGQLPAAALTASSPTTALLTPPRAGGRRTEVQGRTCGACPEGRPPGALAILGCHREAPHSVSPGPRN